MMKEKKALQREGRVVLTRKMMKYVEEGTGCKYVA